MPRMYGKSFADGTTVVNANVHVDNVKAFEAAGWLPGEKSDAPEASVHDGKIAVAQEKEDKAAEKVAEKEEKAEEALAQYRLRSK